MIARARLLSLALVLAACASTRAPTPPTAASTSATTTPAPDATAAAGPIDLGAMDRSVHPGDDFFAYANGRWLTTAEIPPDRPAWGVSGELDERIRRQVRDILEAAARSNAAPGSVERKVGDFYASAMDEAAVEARGLAPLKPALERIAAVKTRADLATYLGEELRADVDAMDCTGFQTPRLFGLWVAPDLNAPARSVPYLLQGGIGLPDREYYLSPAPKMVETRERYHAHIAAVLGLARIGDAPRRADRVFALETKIAQAHATRLDSLEVANANNPWPRTEWSRRAPGLDWTRFFAAAGLDAQPVVFAWHPKATAGLAALVATEPLEAWKDWATFHAIDLRAPYLSKAFQVERFDFYGRMLGGATEQAARWKRAQSWLNGWVGEGVGRLYVERHFSPEAKARVSRMVKTIADAFVRRIDALDWMAPSTKAQAKAKVQSLYVGVGYPDKWTDWSGLEVARDDLVGNVERAERFQLRQSLAELGKPVDRTHWCMLPQVVNAVNLPMRNALSFPAAILQPPYFDPDAPASTNYGAIGTTIGHEISHSFDDQGSLFDSTGKLENWWTKDDLTHFQASGIQLAAQFDAYRPFPDLHVNGKQTLSENIADLAGIAAAHDGWLASLEGKPAPVVQGFTGEQQFFIGYAQSWRTKFREPLLRLLVVSDGHAPDAYRAQTVRNLDAWYTSFGVKPGQALYLAPEDRVRVW
ncbi:MAG TPA: M13 family metallopeptidase [Myxococcaceae bacterium]|nr:M13 family metallopeptidase [Myxococcaceae bacterium]